jgi:hypothetical protein
MKKKTIIVFEEDGKNISTEYKGEIDTVTLIGLLEQLKITLVVEKLLKGENKTL